MQTFVAFAGAVDADVEAAAERVEARYAARWATPPTRHAAVAATAGVLLWQGRAASRWPAWARAGRTSVASLYAPLGYERVVAAEPLDTAPLRLADALRRRPAAVQELCPPFVSARLDAAADRLTLHTDALGVGRLFEVRTPAGWVWSNRPEAALAFAGMPARPDEVGWQHIAVADELFGEVTAYEGVRAVDAATTIEWDGRDGRRTVQAFDTVSSWVCPHPERQARELIEIAAHDLEAVAHSVARLYPERPVVDLTGGRDSRLVAAAFLASGVDVTLHTHDALPGDLEVARELVALLPDVQRDSIEHRIEHVVTGGIAAPRPWAALASATGWHAFAEGLRPFSYLHYPPPEHLDAPRPLAIGGAGGEVAHGYYYPRDLDALRQLPEAAMLEMFAESIVARHAPATGAQPNAREQLRRHLAATLRDIAARGHREAAVLDVFYLRERIRRWGSTGERPGVVSPLLATSFMRACLALTPQQRTANVVHRELTRRLAPRWADVPYYPAERRADPQPPRPQPRVVRVADATDRHLVGALLADRDAWAAAFDPEAVAVLWRESLAGRTDARQERVLRAAVWRGAFTDHLDALAGRPARRQPSHPRNLAQRLARTSAWGALRDTRSGGAIRAAAAAGRRRGLSL